jgi:4-amino-4-deoxy-L-arabinose transferase-like glycosyltransferase
VSRLRFLAALALIALAGLGVRTAFTLAVAQQDHHLYDAFYYELQADAIAKGKGFTDPFAYLPGGDEQAHPAADHPPLTAAVLGGVAWVMGPRTLVMRFVTVLAGVATVVLLGFLGRAVANDRVGLIAAGTGALYPFLWLNDGLLMSEAFAALLVTAAMLLCYRTRTSQHPLVAGLALGVVCGLATLTRAELALLAPGFVIVLLLPDRSAPVTADGPTGGPTTGTVSTATGGWWPRLAPATAVLVAALVVVAPWSLYNQSRFERSVLISSNDGLTLLGANCHAAYHGSEIGLWVIAPGVCIPAHAPPGDQSVVSDDYRHDALVYARGHASWLPVVLAARLGRTWNLYRPVDMLRVNEREGRPRWATALGLVVYYPLVVLAVAGAVWLRRRRGWLAPLLVAPVVVTVATLAFYGQTRIRLPAEPVIVLLAGVAVDHLLTRRREGPLGSSTAAVLAGRAGPPP